MAAALRRLFSASFGLDTRSLSLWRVCLACVVVLDLFDRLTDLRAHYSDEGYWPRRLAIQYAGEDYHLSCARLHLRLGIALDGPPSYESYSVEALTVQMTWFMTTSLQTRNYFVGHSGDTYLRMMLFWAIFMPLGEHFSLDRIRLGNSFSREKTHYQCVGVGGIGALFQLMYVYTGSALEKRSRAWDAWYKDGSATYWALHSIPYFMTSFGNVMASLDKTILQLMTWSVLVWEIVGPFAMMSPLIPEKLKMAGVIGTFMLHFGFALCMKLEEFVWMGCTAAFFALPPLFWDSILPRISSLIWKGYHRPKEINIHYNRDFHAVAKALDAFLLLPNARWTRSLDEEEAGKGSAEFRLSVQVANGKVQHDVDAVLCLLGHSPIVWPLALLQKPIKVLFAMYVMLVHADLAETESTPPPSPRGKKRALTPLRLFLRIYFSSSLWLNVIGGVCVLWVLVWNLGNVGLATMPATFWSFGMPMMLDQTWNMFAPPPKHVTWHLIELNLKSGPPLELIKAGGLFNWHGVPYHTTQPEPWYANYGNHRNFKYWENYSYSSQNIDSRLEFGRWVCREWNSRHSGDETLMSHKTHYYFTPADLPHDQQLKKAETEVMWDHSCF